jgi:hypothetical protein
MDEKQNCLELLSEQNKILERQNIMMSQILNFMCPVASFFSAFRSFVIFVAWAVGLLGASVALWQIFLSWAKGH